jgi:hypothetical protein
MTGEWDLFSQLDGPRDGETFDPYRDEERLNKQARAVFTLVRDERWRTLKEISDRTGCPEASVSARLRDFRKPKFGGLTVEKRHVSDGLWEYRVLPALVSA